MPVVVDAAAAVPAAVIAADVAVVISQAVAAVVISPAAFNPFACAARLTL